MILIELNGERQLVESLDGYDGWTVVGETRRPAHARAERRPTCGKRSRRSARHRDRHAPTPSGAVQIDEQSKVKINGLVTMAMLACSRRSRSARNSRSPTTAW
jgi:hypothetical protein